MLSDEDEIARRVFVLVIARALGLLDLDAKSLENRHRKLARPLLKIGTRLGDLRREKLRRELGPHAKRAFRKVLGEGLAHRTLPGLA